MKQPIKEQLIQAINKGWKSNESEDFDQEQAADKCETIADNLLLSLRNGR